MIWGGRAVGTVRVTVGDALRCHVSKEHSTELGRWSTHSEHLTFWVCGFAGRAGCFVLVFAKDAGLLPGAIWVAATLSTRTRLASPNPPLALSSIRVLQASHEVPGTIALSLG